MKSIPLAILLAMFSVTAFADQTMRPDGMGGWIVNDTGGCGGLYGAAQGECIANRQIMQQQQQQLQLQQLQQQKQLQQQQQQVENQRLQNELPRRKLEDQQSTNPSKPQESPQVDYSKTPDFQKWQSENPWFGPDRAKTEFALLYAKQLRQERAELIGRPFFDAVSIKVNETFGVAK